MREPQLRTPPRRPAWRSRGAAIAVGAALLSLHGAPARAEGDEPVGDESMFIGRINDLRSQRSLPPLRVDPLLMRTAREWSARMAEAGTISHDPDLVAAITTDWVKLGENVGSGGNSEDIHDKFVESPRHLDNLLDPQFDSVGVGVVISGAKIYVTERFQDLPDRPPAAPGPKPPAGNAAAGSSVRAEPPDELALRAPAPARKRPARPKARTNRARG